MRKVIAGPVLVGLIGLAALAVPAAAHADEGNAGDTTTTFTISAGPLTISTPSSADLGTASIGNATISAQLGNVSVLDERATISGSWTASVTSTAFTTGGRTGAETIPAGDVAYNAGDPGTQVGSGTFSTGGSAGALDSAQTAFTASNEVGTAGITWNPTITVTLPATVVAGTYSGTITHSVA